METDEVVAMETADRSHTSQNTADYRKVEGRRDEECFVKQYTLHERCSPLINALGLIPVILAVRDVINLITATAIATP